MSWYVQKTEGDPDEHDDSCHICSGQGCPECDPCFSCGKRVAKGKASLAYNLPGVTPGPIYFCHECEPIRTPEEIQQSIEDFMMPRRGPDRDGD